MDANASVFLFFLLLLAFGAGLLIPKQKPPKPPDHVHHVWDTHRD